jgi:hypothetical protein
LGAVFHKFDRRSRNERVLDKAKVSPMFLLPVYDPTALAMLGLGILAVLGLPFIF